MRQRVWRAGKIAVGIALLVLGVIGLFLPFLQGVLFLVMGLTLLSTESTRAKRWLHYLQHWVGWHHRPESKSTRRTDDTR